MSLRQGFLSGVQMRSSLSLEVYSPPQSSNSWFKCQEHYLRERESLSKAQAATRGRTGQIQIAAVEWAMRPRWWQKEQAHGGRNDMAAHYLSSTPIEAGGDQALLHRQWRLSAGGQGPRERAVDDLATQLYEVGDGNSMSASKRILRWHKERRKRRLEIAWRWTRVTNWVEWPA